MAEQRPPIDDDENDDELELEPVDPKLLEWERKKAEERTAKALTSVDIEELVRAGPHEDYDVDLGGLRNIRFSTRHLLILTALAAVVITFFKLSESNCLATFILGVIALAAGWIWVIRTERRLEAEREQRRRQLLAGGVGANKGDVKFDELKEESIRGGFAIDFRFSMKQVLIAFAVASVIMTLLTFLQPEKLALILGLIALLGLVIHAAGFDPPRAVILGWWMLLVLYIVIGLLGTMWPDEEDGSARPSKLNHTLVASVSDDSPSRLEG